MTKHFFVALFLVLHNVIQLQAQNRPRTDVPKIKITGIIVEKSNKQPLEYATITFFNTGNSKIIGGGITNAKGEFEVMIVPGNYIAKAEFISYKPLEIKAKDYQNNQFLGMIPLEEDAVQLKQVEVRAEKSTVDIKLDKKVYNVGQDLMVKGGTVSDVLDNIPSVSVDADGNILLRGNDNVKILIDGRPSNAINITEALKQISADAIDKVEIITNPSARYDAEGSGGIINILLKKGKNQGINGTLVLSAGSPENSAISGSFNIKGEESNIFGSIGYRKNDSPGNTKINQENFDTTHNLINYIEERRKNNRRSEGMNANFGVELYTSKKSSWTNSMSLRNNKGSNPETVTYDIYPATGSFLKNQRFNDVRSKSQNAEYATNFTQRFAKDGHKFSVDASFSINHDDDVSGIYGTTILPVQSFVSSEKTSNKQRQNRNMIQSDYVLPLGKDSQFEAGFKGDYSKMLTEFRVDEDLIGNGQFTPNTNYTNTLDYRENVTAAYTQFGSKIKKFSYLLGLRYEYSKIVIDQYTTQDFNIKKYDNWFLSIFLNYEISQGNTISISYSKRINRPRGRFINPFSSYSSNLNIFQGNPDIDPTLIDAYDVSYLKKWGNKITLSASAYTNIRHDAFQFVRFESGRFIDGNPVIINTPFNLTTSQNTGFEFTVNYSPVKWWRLNTNFNFFNTQTSGSFSYKKADNTVETIDFDNSAGTWFARLGSKMNLPYKVDFQLNATYDAAQKTAQGSSKAVGALNLAWSRDIFKDKATLALNINDVFNSRKRINEVQLLNVNSYSEMQWRQRQITLSLTFRFNKQKTDREKQPKRENGDGGGDDFPG